MAKSKEPAQSYEASLQSLERIVTQLESGDLPLERALELYEEGIGLARNCQVQLEDAERRVELLLRERDEIKTIPFDLTKDPTLDASLAGRFSANSFTDAEAEDVSQDNGKAKDDSIPF